MKKINYKGRCEKRKVSKCEDICRTYSKIQSAMVDIASFSILLTNSALGDVEMRHVTGILSIQSIIGER